jgi:hypothetical protein
VSAVRAFRFSFVAGLVVLVLAVVSAAIEQPQPCGALPTHYAPVIAFELARTRADLVALFGAEPSTCRAAMVATMNAANWADLFLFMPAYGVFLAFFFVGQKAHGGRIAQLGVRLAIVAGVADVVENLFLFRVTANVDAAEPWLGALAIATGIKWLALGVIGALTAILILAMAGRGRRFAALCSALALPIAIATLFDPNRFGPFVSLAVGGAWLVILVLTGISVRRGSPAGRAALR